ncbi:hypothetical protein Tco_1509377 [Tanacetum coccineum]
MHCTTRGNITHNFLWLKEGAIYSVKNFTVQPNKDEFRVIRFADFMLEFHGDTTVWKAFVRGQSIRVTLWGGPGDMLIEKRTRHLGLYPVGLIAVSVKLYNNRFYLSSTSSTLIVDDEQIPVLKRLKTDDSSVEYSVIRYRLDLEISDDTVEAAVVMFDETARSLLKCSASSIVGSEDQDEEEHSGLPPALANIVGTSHTLELKSHTYYEHGTYESFIAYEDVEESASSGMVAANADPKALVLKILTVTPSVAIPSKPGEEKKQRREELQDSDADESFVADSEAKGGDVRCSSDTRKRKRSAKRLCWMTRNEHHKFGHLGSAIMEAARINTTAEPYAKEKKSRSKVVKNDVAALKKKAEEVTMEAVINEMSKVKLNDDVINASVDVAKKEQSTKQKKGWMIKGSYILIT